jgi:hypothetical protein
MSDQHSLQEQRSHAAPVTMGSNRGFGLVMAGAFAVVALLPLWGGGAVRPWALALAVLFAVAALIYPPCLQPLNRLWFRFGLVLHRVMTPLIMGIMFYVVITPMGLIMRAFGYDGMGMKRKKGVSSYWITRKSTDFTPDSLKNQF